MKRKYILFGAVLLLLLAAISAFSYLHVDGRELKSISNLSEDYTVTVTKTHATLSQEQTEHVLSKDQILQLKNLIMGSSFTRRLTSSFSYSGLKDTYSIIFELTDQHGKQVDFVSLYCVEDLYLRISFPYAGEHFTLKINDPQWHAALEAILEDA